jgi:hypothetical protein
MRGLIFTLLFFSCFFIAHAGRITGTVTDDKGSPLAYASILIKGSSQGTTANNRGQYFLEAEAGAYTIVAQYVGYIRQEKTITVGNDPVLVDFKLSLLQLSLTEVVVKRGGEDPAYEIIRNAIKKRKEYENPLDSFTCEAYIKTLLKTRKLPGKLFGKKLADSDRKEMGVDSVGKGVIYLSESLTKIAFTKPEKYKLEVLSGRESGSNGYGFNFPAFINFYNNNVTILTRQFNPRGYISPISDGALAYYRYKYLGSFWEDGKEINEIKVIPRRKYEPLFSGIINITEGDWRIHSLDLMLLKEYQLELMDTMKIQQIHVPISPAVWRTKDQVVYFTFNMLGVEAVGNFLNVYNKYDQNPQFKKKYFNNIVVKYDTTVNKKSKQYWDSIRPVQLEPEEIKDYITKDSIYQFQQDSMYSKRNIDSLRKKQGPVTLKKIFWSGFSRSNYNPSKWTNFTWEPVIKLLEYNTVEGLVANAAFSVRRSFPKQKFNVTVSPNFRYGFSNKHFNAWTSLQLTKRSFVRDSRDEEGGGRSRTSWTISGGKRISQFNKDNPILTITNSLQTLLFRENYMKLYENYFVELGFNKRFENDLRLSVRVLYEDRLPVDNTTDFSIFGSKDELFTPNYPFEKINTQFNRHQAVVLLAGITFQPGQRFIQFPDRKMPVGSEYPTFSIEYQKGFSGIAGSDVDFDKWKFSITDDVNLKLRGSFRYRLGVGGFLNDKKVFIQDFQHFNGNQLFFASEYLNSFQVAPYYANSTTKALYAVGHIEHHFNGLITNKIPLFRKLKWNLVAGSNAFYVNKSSNYVEVFAGLENIFKIFRVDVVGSYLNGNKGTVAVRLGFGGLFGSAIRLR